MRISILDLPIRILSPLALLLMASSISPPLHAQSNEARGVGIGFPEFFSAGAGIRAETSAKLASWDPEALTGIVAVRYEYPEGYHQIDDPIYFTLKPEPAPAVLFGPPLKAKPVFKNGIAEYFDETTIIIEFQVSQEARPQRLAINALFQICNLQGICLFPDSELLYVDFDPAAPALEPDDTTLAILDWSISEDRELQTAALGSTPSDTDIPADTDIKRTGMAPRILLILLMALAGGVLLNIMPCIFPLLSVKALNLVNQAGQSRKTIFAHSLLYVAGIEISLFALAAIVIALKASGSLFGWGFQLQSPLFVLILIAIIWLFALSLFDVFVIEAPRRTENAGRRGGFGGSFLTGVFAVLIAAPCTAPLLGPVLGFAFSQTPPVIIAIFGLIGLGFGFPFLLLGLYPGLGEKLPKPGPWMNTFKEAMGFLLIGIVVYLFTTFIKLAPSVANGVLWWLLFLGFSAWLLGKARGLLVGKAFRFTGQILALVIAIGSGFLFVDLSQTSKRLVEKGATESTERLDEASIIAFDEQKLQNLIALGKPVFLEFSADWCTTCKINQRVIKHREIRALMVLKGIVHVKADLTAYDENLIQALVNFGRASLPLYVLYRPGEKEPLILPTFISVQKLRVEMDKIR